MYMERKRILKVHIIQIQYTKEKLHFLINNVRIIYAKKVDRQKGYK